MRSRRRRPLLAVLPLLTFLVAACDGEAGGGRVVEVFGNVVGEPGRRLAQVLHDVSAGSGVELRYIGVTSFNQQLEDRLESGDRPGIVLVAQPGRLTDLAERGVLQPVDNDLAVAMEAATPPALQDLVSVNGRPAAIMLTADVKGLVWYRPSVLAAEGHSVPQTLADFEAMLQQERSDDDGVAPTCVDIEAGASTGWPGTDWVESLVLRRLGAEAYDDWVDGALPFDSPEIAGVFEELDALLRPPGAVAGGTSAVSTPWQAAAGDLLSEPPGCLTVHQGDFLRREFPTSATIGPDGDVDFFPLPSVDGGPAPILLGGLFAAPLGDAPEVGEAMRLLAGGETGTALLRTGWFLSPNPQVDWSQVNDPTAERLTALVADAAVVRFDGSDMMVPAIGTGSFWSGMTAFFAGESIPSVLAAIEAGRPVVLPAG